MKDGVKYRRKGFDLVTLSPGHNGGIGAFCSHLSAGLFVK